MQTNQNVQIIPTMQYREDRRSGNKLSILGLGCMRFTRGLNTRIDMDKAEKVICTAIEGGINYLDTAYVYGGSEEALGEILERNNLRDKIYLATKLPHYQCKKYEDFDRIFEHQCTRLRTDYIDYYLIHNLSAVSAWERMKSLGIEEWLASKRAEGRIAQIGFSCHGSQSIFLELLEAYDWDFCQIQYNYLDENYQAGRIGLQTAQGKGLMVVIMEPLLGGKLATGLPKKVTQLFREADQNRSAAAWALRWLWDQPEVTIVLSGMNTVEQLDDNLHTAADAVPHCLSSQDTATLEAAIKVFHETYKVDCTGCNYCMPCPQGVNIPGCFSAYNMRYVAGFMAGMTSYVTSAGLSRDKSAAASSCTKCKACVSKCPQHIAIPDELEQVRKKMEPFWFGPILNIVRKAMS